MPRGIIRKTRLDVVLNDIGYRTAVAVTPADGADLATAPTSALHISVAGALVVDMYTGATVTFANVPAGVFPIAVKRVRATGTAATGIVALYA